MHKPTISAKEVLLDIRSGMDDPGLMQKYKLSEKGLQSMFKKLGQAGIIKHLNAHAVMADLRSGIGSNDLMKKYRLNDQGLQNLFQELDKAGLLKGSAKADGVPEKVVVNINRVVADIQAGLGKSELMIKYRLSPRALRWVSMTLISSGTIPWQQVYDRLCISYDELVPDKLRQTKRYPVPFDCNVREATDPGVTGKLKDISSNGLGIIGMKTNVGTAKTMVIPEDEFGEFASFTFDTECRWVTKDPRGVFVAGFEISHISIGSLREFQILYHLVQFGNRNKKFL